MKRWISLWMALFLLCGCAPNGKEASSSQKPLPEGPIHLRVWTDGETDAWEAIAAAYTDCALEFVKAQDGDENSRALRAALAGKEAPDVFLLQAKDLAAFKASCEDLSAENWVNNAPAGTMTEVQDGTTIFAMPAKIEGVGFLYRKDVFSAAGINRENINSFSRLCDTATLLAERIRDGGFEDFKNLKSVFGIPQEIGEVAEKFLPNIALSAQFDGTSRLLREKLWELEQSKALKSFLDLQKQYACFETDPMQALTDGEVVMTLASHTAVDGETVGLMPVPVPDGAQDCLMLQVPQYWAVNAEASAEKKKAAKKFLTALYTDSALETAVVHDWGIVPPFGNFEPETEAGKEVRRCVLSGRTLPMVTDGLNEEQLSEIGQAVEGYLTDRETFEQLTAQLLEILGG